MNILNLVEKKYFKTEGVPEFRPGDTLRVHVKVKEGVRERIQIRKLANHSLIKNIASVKLRSRSEEVV